MTRDEFIAEYCERSGVSWEWLSQRRDAVPCSCGYPACKGWAMVPLEDVAEHMEREGWENTK